MKILIDVDLINPDINIVSLLTNLLRESGIVENNRFYIQTVNEFPDNREEIELGRAVITLARAFRDVNKGIK